MKLAVQHRYFVCLSITITKTGYFDPGHRTHCFINFLGSEERGGEKLILPSSSSSDSLAPDACHLVQYSSHMEAAMNQMEQCWTSSSSRRTNHPQRGRIPTNPSWLPLISTHPDKVNPTHNPCHSEPTAALLRYSCHLRRQSCDEADARRLRPVRHRRAPGARKDGWPPRAQPQGQQFLRLNTNLSPLTGLRLLFLMGNELSDPIPPSLGVLHRLYRLDVQEDSSGDGVVSSHNVRQEHPSVQCAAPNARTKRSSPMRRQWWARLRQGAALRLLPWWCPHLRWSQRPAGTSRERQTSGAREPEDEEEGKSDISPPSLSSGPRKLIKKYVCCPGAN